MAKRKLNLDIGGKITELESAMEKFKIKNILYKTVFRGKGLEFDGYRVYTPDDDASTIDWKASARSDRLLVKKFVEERDLKIIFLIDVSENMVFGSTKKLKCEYAAELSASLAHLIMGSNDKIGFVFYNEGIRDAVINAKTGKKRFSHFISKLSDVSLYGGSSNLQKTLDYLMKVLDDSVSAVIIISDFLKINKKLQNTLRLFSGRFETIGFRISDPLDKTLPNVKGEVVLEDPKTREQLIVDPSITRKQYEKNTKKKDREIKKIFENSNADLKEINTSKPFVPEIASFLKSRIEKGKSITP